MNLTPLDPWIRQKISCGQAALTRAEVENWQLQRLNETLAHVGTHSGYYRAALAGLPRRLEDLSQLRQLPFTGPASIRQNPLQFVCVSQGDIQRVVTLQSSGTSGAPKRIYFTAADQELTVDFFGVGMSVLTEPGERVLILLPGATPGSVGDLLRLGLSRLGRVPIPYGPIRDPDAAILALQEQQPDCLVGIPTQVLGLARRWKPGLKPPRTVLLSTDVVPAAMLRFLEERWGCRVFNHYGSTEMGLGGGVECEAHRGCHLREADLLFEVVDPQSGQPLPDGEYGEVVFSTLTRTGMPLIRYRTGDLSRFIPGGCPCGTALRTLENIRARLDGLLDVGGARLRLVDFDEALFALPDLLNFSVTVQGGRPKPAISIQAQMLTDTDASPAIHKALEQIPAVQHLPVQVHCRYAPAEAGSLQKRVINDLRGEHA